MGRGIIGSGQTDTQAELGEGREWVQTAGCWKAGSQGEPARMLALPPSEDAEPSAAAGACLTPGQLLPDPG